MKPLLIGSAFLGLLLTGVLFAGRRRLHKLHSR